MNILRRIFLSRKKKQAVPLVTSERCVSCGAITETQPDYPIEKRPNYVSGCGQLCPECYDKLYGSCEYDDEDSRIITAALSHAAQNK